MSEEVTYADLKFQNSSETEKIQEIGKFGEKAPPAPSRVWRPAALFLTVLCLLTLIGLGVLGSMFHITLKTAMKKMSKLQNINEELQRNVSLQLMSNMNSSNKIRNLSTTLQTIATRLCRELYSKEQEHKCKPCPRRWIWHKDSCYFLSDDVRTWQESRMACAAQNASLLKINNKNALEFIKSQSTSYPYWLGLSPEKDYSYGTSVDNIINSSAWVIRNASDLNNIFCGYINRIYVHYDYCIYRKKMICEKMANPVQLGFIHFREA
ncbi:PREDICTED: C-type lectin domain family 12 member A isoform X1 [Cercocebus atys]|nr:PREDICTED: C-type lectin domain family 12 member A isoform X1 [Cercocebus atys]XP_011920138.1 PREDICTED: C-type lectin domain family 12 member A isoform X1 [Cercocebus atys]XP_011920139.1 PREDICTED: C-type lectin domain family 12 member A isoform X1 [Cercocebus atys]XP_011920140.1 PREDICTED: C-type lectin domain family 12 member A isoform X1 [Cercocebus atys]XP_011920142.1 PREDICTED: C-type lectin domain family 12 member A isoform X1 [Cercocebus atys]